jgi:hypothetical protein
MKDLLKHFVIVITITIGLILLIVSEKNPLTVIQNELKALQRETKEEEMARLKKEYWERAYQMPQICVNPRTALKELECKNQKEMAFKAFEAQWNQAIAGGWNPR